MITRGELARRVIAVETRLEGIDLHGTRGVETVRLLQTEQAKALGQIVEQIKALSSKVDDVKSGRWGRYFAFAAALLPVYVLLFLAVFNVHT